MDCYCAGDGMQAKVEACRTWQGIQQLVLRQPAARVRIADDQYQGVKEARPVRASSSV
jgi:hypothetical protein